MVFKTDSYYNGCMLAKVFAGATVGVDGVLIEVEVDVANRGFPTFTIVGLPNKAVDEAKDRVRTAIIHMSYEMPDSRITVNLAPANIPKTGSSFDLPIAVGILAASGFIERERQSIYWGAVARGTLTKRLRHYLNCAYGKRIRYQKSFYSYDECARNVFDR